MSRLSEGRGNDWKEAPVEGVMSKENVNITGKSTGEHVRCYKDDIKLQYMVHDYKSKYNFLSQSFRSSSVLIIRII